MKLDLERLAMELHEARMQSVEPKRAAHYRDRFDPEPRCWKCGTRLTPRKNRSLLCACEDRQ